MAEEKDAFYVVRKGDVVAIYNSLSDCQAQSGSSVIFFNLKLKVSDFIFVWKLHVKVNSFVGLSNHLVMFLHTQVDFLFWVFFSWINLVFVCMDSLKFIREVKRNRFFFFFFFCIVFKTEAFLHVQLAVCNLGFLSKRVKLRWIWMVLKSICCSLCFQVQACVFVRK